MQTRRLRTGWRIAIDPDDRGRREGWFTAVRPEAQPAWVPGVIQEAFPHYHGLAWYWTAFTAPEPLETGQRCHLRIGSIDYMATVWVNGVEVAVQEGPNSPFSADITPQLAGPGAANLVAVRVLNPTSRRIDGMVLAETPHSNKSDDDTYTPGRGYNYGGITEEVELQLVPAIRVEDLCVRPDLASGHISVRWTIRNDTEAAAEARCEVAIGSAGGTLLRRRTEEGIAAPPGRTAAEADLTLDEVRPWELADPFLYMAMVRVEAGDLVDTREARFGFRDFRVRPDGFFELNGRPIFVRSTHTGNHVPITHDSTETDCLRRDLIYLKTAGFNMVRYLAGLALPEQLDLCDEIGLMVYEEPRASWLLGDSPRMAERFEESVRQMVRRDRNHPSVTAWGMLNETREGPVFRQAVAALQPLRDLDPTRLVLLSSGRWDGAPEIGSVANPGERSWQRVWGAEGDGAAVRPARWDRDTGGYVRGAGDAHLYPAVPHTEAAETLLRTMGEGMRPVFLSEYGIGSLFNAVEELAGYEQAGAPMQLAEPELIRNMVEGFRRDWERYGLDAIYAFPRDLLRESQLRHSRHRLYGLNLIRSNSRIAGHNVTGMLDHAVTGEGMWTFWRRWKPGVLDAIADGFDPLRWCVHTTPFHGYAGRAVRIEAILANEGVLRPGEYRACLRVLGPEGPVHSMVGAVRVPDEGIAFAIPCIDEELVIERPGEYRVAVELEGAAPAGGTQTFVLSEQVAAPPGREIGGLGLTGAERGWLEDHGVACRAGIDADLILVGGDVGADRTALSGTLRDAVEMGATAVLLAPQQLVDEESRLLLLPGVSCTPVHDWLYHSECVGFRDPLFSGLQTGGILDWYLYGQAMPRHLLGGDVEPVEIAAASFTVGQVVRGGYRGGLSAATYGLGKGRVLVSTFRILEELDHNPAADRMLMNIIEHARPRIGRASGAAVAAPRSEGQCE
ncbi:MAG TPA: glycoside hydrolase family 2 TIM barrel-domain containing protein [Candidatus Dormibacteraeota bacterium]|jgi:hypothetical protein|nr:glycoside hydrolase family 2 TIM barrel-domain containing protein [Candidatus Dormibacteraeota bacterium]